MRKDSRISSVTAISNATAITAVMISNGVMLITPWTRDDALLSAMCVV